MADDARARLKEWLASGQARLVPLTFPQRELWETAAVPPGDASNNICSLLDIRGPLTPELCREALGMVVARQEALRT
ncbi:MAG: condensation domain protein, partial [Chthoniobacterales bacterium]